ncbi:MAG: DUF72 domain-containing protein [Nitrososphaerota archaeon]
MKVYIGCCGFPIPQNKYVEEFNIVELQSTFYRIPRLSTVKRWREKCPRDFIFTVKAFQGITHSMKSPTWKRSNIKPNANYGEFKPTDEVYESWEITKQICEILLAPITIIQTPPTFKDTSENLKNIETFFTTINRGKIMIGFEPRGWQKENIIKICKKFDLIHVTDPFQLLPLYTLEGRTTYLRLHGSPPGKRMYTYKYTDEDLMKLKELITNLKTEKVYILFNNISMYEDSKRLIKLFT